MSALRGKTGGISGGWRIAPLSERYKRFRAAQPSTGGLVIVQQSGG